MVHKPILTGCGSAISRSRPFAAIFSVALLAGLPLSCKEDASGAGPDTDSDNTSDATDNIGQEGCVLHCEVNLGVLDSLPDDLCEAVAEAELSYFQRCAVSMTEMVGASNFAAYRTLTSSWCTEMHYFEGLEGQPTLDDTLKTQYRACLLSFVNSPCGCPITCAPLNAEELSGNLADGEICQQGTQCQSGYCESEELWGCGVCAMLQDGLSEGETCVYDSDCDWDLYCDVNALTCKPVKQACDACAEDNECGSSLECIRGECAFPYLEAGEDCEDSRWGCMSGLECRDVGENGAFICAEPYYRHVPVGEPCNVDLTAPLPGRATCDMFGYCNAEENGVCTALGLTGDPCTVDENGDSTCFILLTCENGYCAYPNPTCK